MTFCSQLQLFTKSHCIVLSDELDKSIDFLYVFYTLYDFLGVISFTFLLCSMLALRELTDNADCVLPIENQVK